MMWGLWRTRTAARGRRHADGGAPQAVTQVRQSGGADIAQVDALEGVPDALIGVQVWGVAWQPLQLQALGGSRHTRARSD